METNRETPAQITEGDAVTRWSRDEKVLLAGSIVLITLAAFEALAAMTIMPNVVADLGSDTWFAVASGAAIAMQLASTVIAGPLCDARGPRKVLLWGAALFVVGLALCTFAGHIALFVIGRMIQGLGGGLVMVPIYVFVGSIASPRHRPTFFAAFSMAWVFPSLVGPAIAGWVTATWGWRWVFGVVPFIAAVGLAAMVPVLRRFPSRQGAVEGSMRHLAALAAGAGGSVVLVQFAGTLSGWALVAATVLGLAGCAMTLKRLVPDGTFTLRPGIASIIATRALVMGGLSGAEVFLPLALQRVHLWSASHASLAVTIGSITWAIGSAIPTRVNTQATRERLPLVGASLMVVGVLPVCFLVLKGLPPVVALVGWSITGLGIGMVHSTLSDLTLGSIDPSEHGRASSWLQIADNAGGAVELAIVSVVLAVWMPAFEGGIQYVPAPVIALGVCLLAVFASSRIRSKQAR